MYPVPEIRGNRFAMIFCFVLFTTHFAQGQCIASGPKSPTASSSVSFAGSDYSFNNPLNTLVDDASNAVASSILSFSSRQTEYLQVKGFGFSIPAAATICGIEVTVVKSAANVLLNLATVTDYNVRVMKNGTPTGTNLADGITEWPSSDTYTTYGGTNQLWGTTWSPTDINNGNFGFSISAEINGTLALFPAAQINYISMTVYYLDPAVLSASGAVHSTVKPVKVTDNTFIKCYPNPFTTTIQVAGITPGERVALTNMYGQRLYLSPPAVNNNVLIDVNDLQPGIYVISAGNNKMKIQKK